VLETAHAIASAPGEGNDRVAVLRASGGGVVLIVADGSGGTSGASARGQCALAVVAIVGDQLCGASVGDCCVWRVDDGGVDDLSERQARKPLLGSGDANPVKRPVLSRHHPVHVTLRVCDAVWNLRSRRCFRAIARAFAFGKLRNGFRLVHFSVQGNHVHLIVEAESAEQLARGIQGLAIRLARGLNRVMQRRGDVFADRYHAHALRTPTEVANAVAYVLGNFVRHASRWGKTVRADWIDPNSSAAISAEVTGPPLTADPQTWLLRGGWRRGRSLA